MNYTPYRTDKKLDKLVDSDDYSKREEAVNKGYGIDKLINDPNSKVRALIAYLYGNDKEVISKLINDPSPEVRGHIAQKCGADNEVLNKLVNDENSLVRLGVAYGCNGNMQILSKLVNDPYYHTRMWIAQKYCDNKPLIDILINDKNWKVRNEIAAHTNTVEYIKKLSKDEDGEVRCSIAKNDKTPIDVLEILATDDNVNVRMTVAHNDNITENIFRMLFKDKERCVREAILYSQYNKCPADILEYYSKSEDDCIQIKVALHDTCGYESLKNLSTSMFRDVRETVLHQAQRKGCADIIYITKTLNNAEN